MLHPPSIYIMMFQFDPKRKSIHECDDNGGVCVYLHYNPSHTNINEKSVNENKIKK